jgi:tetratricopeptide (TPR) repeat protein
MKILSPPETPTFNLLSIGQRGVGKTVFLAGSYAQFSADSLTKSADAMGMECRQEADKDNLNNILDYISRTGQYPPATSKITNFNFSLKRNQRGKERAIAHWQWWDLPGEYCNFQQREFQEMTLNSHGCCVFINAARLVEDVNYEKNLEPLIKQVKAIASLGKGKVYPFALIFTQCDQIKESFGSIHQLQIEEKLPSLISLLESYQAQFKRFYSAVPIVRDAQGFHLQPTGTSTPFIWLVSVLNQSLPVTNLDTTLRENAENIEFITPKKTPNSLALLTGVLLGSLGLVGAALWGINSLNTSDQVVKNYQNELSENPQDFGALVALANRYLELGEYSQAIPILEAIVQQKPQELGWQVNLARLYELTGKSTESEAIYDHLLQLDKNYLPALLGKAELRKSQGDKESALKLLQKAEQIAPQEQKGEIRNLANSLH